MSAMGLPPDPVNNSLPDKLIDVPPDEHYQPLLSATKSARENLVIQLIRENPNVCRQMDSEGRTDLHWATEYGYFKLAHLLLNTSCTTEEAQSTRMILLNQQDDKGLTPLHIACNCKRDDFASLFITLNADVNIVDVSGNTPLHRAVRGHIETSVVLLCENGADVNSRNDLQWSPLHEAARTGNVTILRVLINHRANLNAVTNNQMSPFLTAFFYYKIASKGNSYIHLDSVWKLLIESGCALSQSDGHWTPLTAAMACDNISIASRLLLNGCQVDRRGRWGRGLLQDAFACSEPMLAKLIVLLGYIPSPEEIQYCSKQLPMYSKVLMRLSGMGAGLHRDRQEVVKWMKARQEHPPSLEEFCRVSIRQAMNVASKDASIIANINHLPIPNRLKQFIGLSDFTHYLFDEF